MTSETKITRNAPVFRAGLLGLGLVQLLDGLYALLAPRSFYDDFPLGRGWVEALPAFNEHLTRDVGGLFLATAVVLIFAAMRLERRIVALALASFLAFALPHTLYHLFNLGPYATGDAIANVLALGFTVLVPVGLLAMLALDRSPLPQAAGAGVGFTGGSGNGTGAREPADGANARIAGVPESSRNPLVRFSYFESKRRYGQIVDPLRVYAHNPKVMMGYAAHEMASERSRRVPDRLKHLAELRAAMLPGCEWCCDFASALGKEVTEEDLRELANHATSERFNALEKLVLAYADGVSRTPVDVGDELFAALAEHLDEAQLVELTDIIALENYRARFNWAFGIGAQGFSEGAYCVRPEAMPTQS